MKIFAADETGLVKEISVEKNLVVQKWRAQDRRQEVQEMCFGVDEREVSECVTQA